MFHNIGCSFCIRFPLDSLTKCTSKEIQPVKIELHEWPKNYYHQKDPQEQIMCTAN